MPGSINSTPNGGEAEVCVNKLLETAVSIGMTSPGLP